MGVGIFIRRNNVSIIENKGRSKLGKFVLFLGLIVLGAIIVSGAVSAATLGNTPQPKLHHDNYNTGQSQYKGPQTNTTKWNYTTGSIITSSPSIGSDGTIYFGSEDRHLYALNPDGTQKWNYTTGSIITSSPSIGSDGTIYFGSEDRHLYALNPDGTQKWNYTTGNGIDSSPSIGSDGTVYFGSNDHNLYALYPNGTKKWNYTTGDLIVSSPAIGSDGTIYFGSRDHKLYALNPDGTQEWNYTTVAEIQSSPAIGSDGTIYFGSDDIKLYALNPDGTQKWNYTMGGNIFSASTIGSDGTIYFGSTDKKFYALNPDGTQKWTYTTGDWIRSSPAIGSDGTIYFGSDDNKLYAVADITASASVKGGYYNTTKTVTLTTNEPGTIYWKWYISNFRTNWSPYTSLIHITSTCNIEFFAKDQAGHSSPLYTETYIIDTTPPTAKANINSGLYNINKIVTLTMSETGTIYYTLNGLNPTTSSTKYIGPIKISSTKILKFLAVDMAGNKSPVYTKTYTIDKTPPKVSTTTPTNLKTGVSRISTIIVKFSEKIKASTYYTNIKVKNMTTGKYVTLSKTISGNTLYIKTSPSRTANTWYQVTIPYKSIKDYAGNNLQSNYTFRFKTGA